MEYYKSVIKFVMVKGFSDNEVKNNTQNTQLKETKKEKKGLAGFLKGKKFTYTLPGKKQINIFGSIVIGLNLIYKNLYLNFLITLAGSLFSFDS